MSVLLLLAGLLPWAAAPADALFRVYVAVGVLSLEMQVVTLSGAGSLRALAFVNAAVAAALIVWQRRARPASVGWVRALTRVAPWPAILLLGALVAALNLLLPLEAADPYHLDRLAQIERLGTLEYDPAAEPKVNVMGWVYEMVLADVRAIPGLGPVLVKMHGLLGLILYLLALAAARDWLGAGASRWPWLVVLVIPVVFHAFVLVKNDLFIAMAAFAALLWLVVRAPDAPWPEAARAGALVGFVVGVKLTNLPLALLLAGGVLVVRRHDRRRVFGAVALGGAVGAIAGGLLFTLLQNARWYGDPMASGPVGEMGNVTSGPGAAAESVLRFAISLVDLGLLTTDWWPGRGGWGGTLGLPFIWGAAVLIAHARRERNARRALAVAGAHFIAFAAVFPDADVAHRLVLASGLLVIVGAADLVARGSAFAPQARMALVPVLVLSTAQIVRSAVLYLGR